MHFFATASLTDCCQMKGKLAGPIGQGRMAVSPSPLDSVSLSEDFCTLKSSGLSVFLVMDSVSCAASLQPEPFGGVYQEPELGLGELSFRHRLHGYESSS